MRNKPIIGQIRKNEKIRLLSSQTKRSTKLSYAPNSRKPSDGYYARIKPNGKEFRLTPGAAGL